MSIIPPRTLSGFRDYLPDLMLAREKVLDATRRVYRSYGFTPIDTPACEALDILLGKGGDESDKLVYRVQSAKSDKVEMGLRFDLTVPFARFAAQYINQLGTPFKRYAMGPVWRGERPGHGRYREFWQCDFDTIGTTSNAADIETALVINDLFEAIGFEKFEVRINNRMVLNGLLEKLNVAERGVRILRAIDKLPKIGREAVASELVLLTSEQAQEFSKMLCGHLFPFHVHTQAEPEGTHSARYEQFVESFVTEARPWLEQHHLGRLSSVVRPLVEEIIQRARSGQQNFNVLEGEFASLATGISREQAGAILDLTSAPGKNEETLGYVETLCGSNHKTAEGLRRLRELLSVAKTSGIPEGRIKIDLSIARGLDYYTGTIYETFLTDLPGIGSVCSGGRYDNLASKYTKQVLPGVGASLGLDRLIAAMEELKHPLLTGQSTPADVLVVQFDAARLGDYERIARKLRAAGIAVEVYPDAKKVGQQLAYAEKRGFKLALIAGATEFEQGVWKVKDLAKREETTVTEGELIQTLR